MSLTCISYRHLDNLRIAPRQEPPVDIDTWSEDDLREFWYGTLANFFDINTEQACVTIGQEYFLFVPKEEETPDKLSLTSRFRTFLQKHHADDFIRLVAIVERDRALGVILSPAHGKTWYDAFTALRANVMVFCDPLRW